MARRVFYAPKHAQRMPTGMQRFRKDLPWHLLTLAPFALCIGAFAYYLSLGTP
jgi:hypothetical protein